jgi:gas vesicle protein
MIGERLAIFLLGVSTGIGIGMIFAPKSGQETRDLLKENADEGKEYLKSCGSELRDNATDVIERGKEIIGRQKDALAEGIAAGKEAYSEVAGHRGLSKNPTVA